MGREGKLKATLEYAVKKQGATTTAEKFSVYNEILKDFDATDLGKQMGLMDVEDFQQYFRQKGTLGHYNADFLAQYMKVAKGGDRKKFTDAVVATT
jgi:hypothetical protein